MSAALAALQPLTHAASEFEPRPVSSDALHFAKLGLCLRVRPKQVQQHGAMALYLGEFTVSSDRLLAHRIAQRHRPVVPAGRFLGG
jgi:hypothetical protein